MAYMELMLFFMVFAKFADEIDTESKERPPAGQKLTSIGIRNQANVPTCAKSVA